MGRPTPGQVAFAATLIALCGFGLISPDLAGVWQPLPKPPLERQVVASICAFVALTSGIGLLWPRTAARAALLLCGTLLLWMLLARLPALLHAPWSQDPWSGAGETAVVLAGALTVVARHARPRGRRNHAPNLDLVRAARTLAAVALIPFGTAHFVFEAQTAALVPDYLPAHHAIALATGTAYLAAALAMLTTIAANVAAILVTLQMALFTLLIWVPAIASGHAAAFQSSEFIISLTLTAAMWLIAETYAPPRACDLQ